MLKKISVVLCLLAFFIMAGEIYPTSEARPVYVGTYSDGSDAYLMTETVYINSYHPYAFTCDVIYYNNYANSLHYNFYSSNGSPYYRNSEGYEGYVYGGQSPFAANIYRFVVTCAPEKLYLVNLKYVIEKTALIIENTCFLACLTTG